MGFVISLKKYIPVDGITEVDIPNNVTSIEEMAFAGCNELTSIKIPSSVESIGDGAFSDCIKLKSIDIPENTFNIGNYIFGKSNPNLTVNCYNYDAYEVLHEQYPKNNNICYIIGFGEEDEEYL